MPSFYSFFGNLHYLAAIAPCLKELVHLDYRQTVADAFEAAFHGRSAELVNDEVIREASLSPSHSRANTAYRQVVLYVMRHLLLLRPESILTGNGPKLTRALGGPSKQQLAMVAERHGFRSSSIDDLISHDVDREVAQQVLLAVRASITTDCSEARMTPLADQLVGLFAEFRRQTMPPPPLDWSPLYEAEEEAEEEVVEPSSEYGASRSRSLDRRRGLPSRHAYEQNCHALTWDRIHAPIPDGLTRPTAFLVQRDIYLFFYGDLDPAPVADNLYASSDAIRVAPAETPVRETTLDPTGEATEAMEIVEERGTPPVEAHDMAYTTAMTLYQQSQRTVPATPVYTESVYSVSR